MQDRFKFRYNYNNEIYDVCFMDLSVPCVSLYVTDEECLHIGKTHFKWENLIQCTGLKDKNGKLIFEGDVVKTITHNPYEKHIGVIRYHTCYFSLDYKEVGKYEECGISLTKNTSDFVTLEMLGNIYENPELIGGAE